MNPIDTDHCTDMDGNAATNQRVATCRTCQMTEVTL